MAFLTLLNGSQMFYHFAELGFDNSKYQNAQGKWGKNDYGIASELGADYDCKMQVKKRIERWLVEGHCRMAAFQKVGQIIQLRTRLMPEVFEGNPTKVDIGGGKKLRTRHRFQRCRLVQPRQCRLSPCCNCPGWSWQQEVWLHQTQPAS